MCADEADPACDSPFGSARGPLGLLLEAAVFTDPGGQKDGD